MKKYKKYLISLAITFTSIIILSLILCILNYYSIISYNLNTILKKLIPIISIFIGNFYLGKNIERKAYLEGLKTGIPYIIILFFLSLILDNFKFINILNYIVTLLFSSIATITSMNLKKPKE